MLAKKTPKNRGFFNTFWQDKSEIWQSDEKVTIEDGKQTAVRSQKMMCFGICGIGSIPDSAKTDFQMSFCAQKARSISWLNIGRARTLFHNANKTKAQITDPSITEIFDCKLRRLENKILKNL